MVNEHDRRRPNFIEGTRIRLANGQSWSFPDGLPSRDDREHLAVLREIGEVEDQSELLQAELALTIFLLSRNYDLRPDDFAAILDFVPGDPAQAAMQRAVHFLAMKQAQVLRRPSETSPRSSEIPPSHSRVHPPEHMNRKNRMQSFRLK